MTNADTSQTSPSIVTPGQVETRTVNPLTALFVELDSLNVTLLRILDLLTRTRPLGRIFPIARTVTSLIVEKIDPPWFSFHLVNDGPDDLLLSVNDRKGPYVSLPPDESLDVNMVEANIGMIYFNTAPGETASFRAYGVY